MPRNTLPVTPDRNHVSHRIDLNTPNILDQNPELNPMSPRRSNHPLINNDRTMSVPPQRVQVPHPQYQHRFYHHPRRFRQNPPHSQFIYAPGFPLRQDPPRGHLNGRRIESENNNRFSNRWPTNIDSTGTGDLNYIGSNPAGDSSNTRREATLVNRLNPETVGETMWKTRGYTPCSKSCAGG